MSYIHLRARDFYTINGRIGRLDLFVGLLCITVVFIAAHYLFLFLIRNVDLSGVAFEIVAGMQLGSLALATPLYIKRFHDLNSSGWWVLVFWAVTPFSFEVMILTRWYLDVAFNPFSSFILLAELFGLLMWLMLLLKRGNPEANKWGCPNSDVSEES